LRLRSKFNFDETRKEYNATLVDITPRQRLRLVRRRRKENLVGISRFAVIFFLGVTFLADFPPLEAQQTGPTAVLGSLPTADDLFDRSVEVSGGREGWLKLTSLHIKGELEIASSGLSGTMEIYSQAPAKVLECLKFETGVFFCRAYDGAMGWQDDSQSGLKICKGKTLRK
jgi:hypothetical protein